MSGTSADPGYLAPGAAIGSEGDALTDAITALVVGTTGLSGDLVRPLWQPDPPAQPPVSTNWCACGAQTITFTDYVFDSHDPAADGGLGRSNIGQLLDAEFLMSFFGPLASAYLGRFKMGITGVRQNLDILRSQGIAIIETGDALAVPDLTNMQWINRVDMRLRVQQTIVRGYAIRSLLAAPTRIVGHS